MKSKIFLIVIWAISGAMVFIDRKVSMVVYVCTWLGLMLLLIRDLIEAKIKEKKDGDTN